MIIQKTQGLEWYDGWVALIIYLGDGQIFAAFAVAVDWDNGRKRYALCSIQKETAVSLLHQISIFGIGPELREDWQKILSAASFYLLDKEPRAGDSVTLTAANMIQRARLSSYQLPIIETSSSKDSVLFWLTE